MVEALCAEHGQPWHAVIRWPLAVCHALYAGILARNSVKLHGPSYVDRARLHARQLARDASRK